MKNGVIRSDDPAFCFVYGLTSDSENHRSGLRNVTVGVADGVGTGIVVPTGTFWNRIPLRFILTFFAPFSTTPHRI